MDARVIILDFGGQYTQLIARTVRELGVYCQILPGTAPAERVLASSPQAVILSGGPASVLVAGSPSIAPRVLDSGIPLFGICYGMQVLAKELGGEVEGWARSAAGAVASGTLAERTAMREFGAARVKVEKPIGPFAQLKPGTELPVWMNHGDKVTKLPPGFVAMGSSSGAPIAIFGDEQRKIYGVQFHPEVHHTPDGKEILRRFLFDVAGVRADWDPKCFASEVIAGIKERVPKGNVLCALSGGVDSTVAAVLVARAIGKRLHCVFVDNGLLRLNEAAEILEALGALELNVHFVDASERFLTELTGVTDPEEKRKIIGRVFIEVFDDVAHQVQDVRYLVQGTLYPDVIESVSVFGSSATIKSHHNVGGLVDNMRLELIEPLRELFKDEVRAVGRGLGIPESFIMRQPFPGPGLAVRCLGELTKEKLERLRRADQVVREEVAQCGVEKDLWQSFAVLLPVYSVGVMGDGRTYEQTIAIRAVTSRDGMTADWVMLPEPVLRRISTRIVNEVSGINRIVLDISTKPPATIEWE